MRDSCIHHPTQGVLAIVREDYRLLMDGDPIAAAILNLFEYWANAEIARGIRSASLNVGCRQISEFEEMLQGIGHKNSIRNRLQKIQDMGFIEIQSNRFSGLASTYVFHIQKTQEALDRVTNFGEGGLPKMEGGVTNFGEGGYQKWSSSIYKNLKEEDKKNKKEKDSLSVSAKTDDREEGNKPKVKTLPNRNALPKEVYASLKNLDGFEKFWGWYDGNCRSHPKRDGSIPAKGSKKFAAIAWRDTIEPLSPEQYQEFRQGCLDFNWNINGVPHAENFLKHEHWKKAIAGEKEFLEDLQGSKESDPQGNINLAPRYSPQNEQKSVSGTIHHPEWLETPERSYIDWLASSYLSRRPEFRDNPPTIAIARTWLAKAKHDSLRFSEAASTWESYLEEKSLAEKRNAKNADWLIPPVDPNKIDHAAVQEGMLRARRIMEQAGIRIGVPNAS